MSAVAQASSAFSQVIRPYSVAKAGAKHVYGVEKANIYVHSVNIIKENGLEDKVSIINGLVEEITLPVEKVDIIISEWMGYFLLYESMFDSVMYARDKWLAPDGIMMPDTARMFIAALNDEHYYHKKLVLVPLLRIFGIMCMGSP
jgi:protein arginine N-methyltransferase 1